MKEKNVIILEPSTNTHKINSDSGIEVENITTSVVKMKIMNSKGVVTHGEHGTICTESKNVIKYVQQEYNPITKGMQNAFD